MHAGHQLHEALGASLDGQHRDDLQRISSAGRHMMHIIDDLRDFADVNRVEITRREVDLSLLARGIIDDLSVLVPDRDVRFEAEPEIKALGDQTLLRILLTNRIALEDLGLKRVAVVHPGVKRFPLSEQVEAVPLSALDGAG